MIKLSRLILIIFICSEIAAQEAGNVNGNTQDHQTSILNKNALWGRFYSGLFVSSQLADESQQQLWLNAGTDPLSRGNPDRGG